MKLMILSDIHGNLTALDRVLTDAEVFRPDALALLGDLIDYGMRSNEVVERIRKIDLPVVCSVWGNHEQSILTEDYTRFSSPRGAESARHTAAGLTQETRAFLDTIPGKCGMMKFTWEGYSFLALHGSLTDPYWKSILPEGDKDGYEIFDYVLSGHSHLPHVFAHFYEANDPVMRNKKRTVFINPGSVGQPRNHDPRAQYAILDMEEGVSLRSVPYDVAAEQALFTDAVDAFYRERLEKGV